MKKILAFNVFWWWLSTEKSADYNTIGGLSSNVLEVQLKASKKCDLWKMWTLQQQKYSLKRKSASLEFCVRRRKCKIRRKLGASFYQYQL